LLLSSLLGFVEVFSQFVQIKAWKTALRHETRGLDRQVMSIEREEMKVKASIKDAAKKGHVRTPGHHLHQITSIA
jgi:hypothetical protein